MTDPLTLSGGQLEASPEQTEDSTPTPPAPSADNLERRWLAWPATALERLPWPYLVTVVLLGLAALGEQLLEYSSEQASLGAPPSMSPFRLVVFPALVFYILACFFILKRVAVRALDELRPSVKVNDQEYEEHVRHMVVADPRLEFILFLVSVSIVLVFFVVLKLDLLNTNRSLPPNLPAAIYIVCMYILLGWLLLTVVYTSLRQTRALNALAHCPLVINGFDVFNLLPLGRMGLIQSLPTVGIVLVPLILLGTPTQGGYLVIFLSAISILALFVPLWGVHMQIVHNHRRSILAIDEHLQAIQDVLLQGSVSKPQDLVMLSNHTSALIGLRKTILEAPSWPFRDTATVVRAAFAVTSPLMYFILNELIRTYILPILTRGSVP